MVLRGRRGGRVRLGRVWCIRGWIFIWLNDCMSAIVESEHWESDNCVKVMGSRLANRS